MSLPESHKGGKLCAYKLICKMSLLRNQDIPVEQDHLSQLFYVIHEGLNSNDQVCMSCCYVVKYILFKCDLIMCFVF